MQDLIPHLVWPAVSLVGFVFFLCFFRKEVRAFINRLKKVGLGDFSVGADTPSATEQQNARAESSGASPKIGTSELNWTGRMQPDSEGVRLFETKLSSDLTKTGYPPERQVPLLVNRLAFMTLRFGFELTYRLIFGSQIRFLHFLNKLPDGLSDEIARQFYAGASKQSPNLRQDAYTEWLHFLKWRDFVAIDSETGHVRIATLGQEFLIWMIQAKVSEDRLN